MQAPDEPPNIGSAGPLLKAQTALVDAVGHILGFIVEHTPKIAPRESSPKFGLRGRVLG